MPTRHHYPSQARPARSTWRAAWHASATLPALQWHVSRTTLSVAGNCVRCRCDVPRSWPRSRTRPSPTTLAVVPASTAAASQYDFYLGTAGTGMERCRARPHPARDHRAARGLATPPDPPGDCPGVHLPAAAARAANATWVVSYDLQRPSRTARRAGAGSARSLVGSRSCAHIVKAEPQRDNRLAHPEGP